MSVINSSTQLQLINNLASLGAPSSSDLLLIQRNLKSFKLSYGELLTQSVDDTTIGVASNKLILKDNAVTSSKINDNSVTLQKIQQINSYRLLGRTSSGTGNIETITLLDEDDLLSNSDTAIPTQQSVKAYVDAAAASNANAFTQYFESSEQTWPSETATLSVAHGFGATPKLMHTVLVCKVSQGGFSVGSEIVVASDNSYSDGKLVTWCNETSCAFRSKGDFITVSNSSGSDVTLTKGNFRIVFRAWR